MALLGWTQDKLRLTRYRHGWGVVCGLEVRCDPEQASGVIVEPGYAVSCCGDDIIVCEPTAFDLSDACREEKDPCAELKKPEEVESEPKIVGVDLYIRYKEEPSDPQTALGRSVCREVAKCEYSRTRETFELTWRFAARGSDPVEAAAKRWHEAYDKCLEVVRCFKGQFMLSKVQSKEANKEAKNWLLRWIDEHPLHQFCFVRDWICTLDLSNEAEAVKVLFWLVQDCRNAFLTCKCHDCQEHPGVPLARVWLQAKDDQGTRCCNVVGIDAYPPYRRPISPECWPAPLGQVNLGQVIWHRWEEARAKLAELGVRVGKRKQYHELATLIAALESGEVQYDHLFAGYEEEVVPVTLDAVAGQVPLGERVVGFRIEPVPLRGIDGADIGVRKSSKPSQAKAGQPVLYMVEVVNTGKVPLFDIKVIDETLGVEEAIEKLDPDSSSWFEFERSVPKDASGKFVNTVTVIGWDREGEREVTATARHTLKIIEPEEEDDLTVIDDIGRKRAGRLREAGITTFRGLAEVSIARLQKIFPKVDGETLEQWKAKARELAG
jgi:hypothetical protein